jgi:hypothetical protein
VAADAAAGPAGSPSRAFASPAQRRFAVLAVALALISVVIGINAARVHPQRRITTVTAPAPPAAVAVDATGCPAQAQCRVQQRAIGLDDAFVRAFPAGQILNVQATLDLRSLRSYRKSLVGSIEGSSTVSLTSQCVPGAPRSRPRLEHSSTSFVDLAGNSVIEFRQLSVLVPGRPGCGVALLLRTRGSAARFEDAALRLARDPAVQLIP